MSILIIYVSVINFEGFSKKYTNWFLLKEYVYFGVSRFNIYVLRNVNGFILYIIQFVNYYFLIVKYIYLKRYRKVDITFTI